MPPPQVPTSTSSLRARLPPSKLSASKPTSASIAGASAPLPRPEAKPDDSATSQKAPSRREEMKEARALEENRKYGLAPLAVDTVTGDEISPHIPRSIVSVPWYHARVGSSTLQHQRKADDRQHVDADAAKHVPKAAVDGSSIVGGSRAVGGPVTRFRAGACSNCGAMTHKAIDCTERKRAVGARYSRKDFAQDVEADDAGWKYKSYEQKRDAGAGVDDVETYVRSHFEAAAAAPNAAVSGGSGASATPPSKALRSETAMEAVVADNSGSLLAEARELPKYLVNLNSGTGHFDPSTRALRRDPTVAKPGDDEKYIVKSAGFVGDNARYDTKGYGDVVQQMSFVQRQARDGEAGTSFNAKSTFLPTENEEDFRSAQAADTTVVRRNDALLSEVYGAAAPRPPSQPTP